MEIKADDDGCGAYDCVMMLLVMTSTVLSGADESVVTVDSSHLLSAHEVMVMTWVEAETAGAGAGAEETAGAGAGAEETAGAGAEDASTSPESGQKVVYTLSTPLMVVVNAVTPVVTGVSAHLLSAQEVTVTTVVWALVTVAADAFSEVVEAVEAVETVETVEAVEVLALVFVSASVVSAAFVPVVSAPVNGQ